MLSLLHVEKMHRNKRLLAGEKNLNHMYEKKKKNLMEIIHDFYICKTGEKFTTIQF